MSPNGAMAQWRVFYTKDWSRAVDSTFVQALVEQTNAGHPIVNGHGTRHIIDYCKDRVNGVFMTTFDSKMCLDRFLKLLKRYQVFTFVKNYPGVEYNPGDDSVKADQATWDAICSAEPLAYVYMNKGEPEYDDLKYVFGKSPPAATQQGGMVEVIEISSDNETMNVDAVQEAHMLDCNTVFNQELAWYSSGSSGSNSFKQSSTKLSRRGVNNSFCESSANSHPRFSRAPRTPTSDPSSVASSSPFKR